MFKVRDQDLAGRIGILKVGSSALETPYLFPVIDLERQEVPLEDLKAAGFKGVITNAYLLLKRGFSGSLKSALPGFEVVMTDSGAYQLLEYGSVDVDNKTIIEFQKEIGSDIAVILDVPTGDSEDRAWAEYTVTETLRRAREALDVIDRGKRLWVLPIQGGVHADLVERCAEEASRLDFDVYALGSPTRMLEKYSYGPVAEMIFRAKKSLPFDKPLHLFGAGHPMIIPFAVAMGVDLFDSAAYVLFARDERYMTPSGTKKLEDLEYLPCACPVCSKRDAKDVKEAEKPERVRLLALHNIYVTKLVLERTKQAIVEGRLWELLEEMSRQHVALYELFKLIAEKYWSWLEERDPRASRVPKAPMLFDELSLRNPKVSRALDFVVKRYEPPPFFDKLVLRPSYAAEASVDPEAHVVLYDELAGILPYELAKTYPLGHAVTSWRRAPRTPSKKVLELLRSYLAKYRQRYRRGAVLEVCEEWGSADELGKELNVAEIVKVRCTSQFLSEL